MTENKQIGQHIATHFLEIGNGEVIDPVLQDWLAESEANRKDFIQYERIWREASSMKMEEFDADLAWRKINRSHQQKETKQNRIINLYYTLSGIAVACLLLFSLAYMGLFEGETNVTASMSANYGSRSNIILPDNSTIMLNSGSEITYKYNKDEKIREVEFQGEGFFDVSKNKRPFVIIMPDGLRIKVLGTSFNLQAYADDPTVEVSLVEGHVELNYEDKKLEIQAGEMAVFDKKTNEIKQTDGLLSHTYGWMDNKLYMDKMSLSEVCKKLERWYDVNIIIQEELGDKISYSGVIQEETITDVMNALSNLSDINYEIKGKNINITSK